jgi:hypothetical protein
LARARSLRVLFVRPGDRQGLHPGLAFAIPRRGGDVLPVGLLALASAVKFGSRHRSLVHDERHPSVSAGGPTRSLRGLSRSLQPDVAVIWLHPALLADGLEAARQARHAGCSAVLGAGPLVELWPEAAGRVLEVDGLVTSSAGLLAALDVLEAGGAAADLVRALGLRNDERWTLDRKLLDYAAYAGVGGPPWPGTGRPRRITSDKGRFAASPVPLDIDACADIDACRLLGIRFLDLVGPGGDDAWWSSWLSAQSGGLRMRLQVTPERLRRLSLTDLVRAGVEALWFGAVGAGDPDAVDDVCAVAEAARKAGFTAAVTAYLGVAGYSSDVEDAGVRRLRSAGVQLDVRVLVKPEGERWADYIDAPSAGFVPPGVDRARLESAVARSPGPGGTVRGLVARVRP